MVGCPAGAGRRKRTRQAGAMYLQRQIANLTYQNYSPKEIALALDVSIVCVSKHIRELQSGWMRDSRTDYAKRMATELAKLNDLEREAREAWEKSKQNAVTRRRILRVPEAAEDPFDLFSEAPAFDCSDLFGEENPVPSIPTAKGTAISEQKPVLVEEVIEERGQCGDVRYLSETVKIIEMRLKVMGAFKDPAAFAEMLSAEQVIALMNAAMRAVEYEGIKGDMLQRIKDRTLKLLPRPIDGIVLEYGEPQVADTSIPSANGTVIAEKGVSLEDEEGEEEEDTGQDDI